MPKSLRNLLKQPKKSQLAEVFISCTDKTDGHYLIIKIDDELYRVVYDTFISKKSITIQMIRCSFESNVPVLVELRSTESRKEKFCLICFHQIPKVPRSFYSQSFPIPPMIFSVCVFEEKLIRMFPAKNSDNYSQSIALGNFNVKSFIREFRRISLTEWRFLFLWRMIIHSLCEIGYFDFFDYDHFMSIVFKLFQRMFYLNEKTRFYFHVLKEFFALFVQRLLMKNSWFLICGELIQTVRSSTLIKLFSNGKYSPNLHFIDNERHLAGISKVSQKENEYEMKMWLVSLQKQDPICIGSEIHQGCDDWNRGIGEEAPNHDHDDEDNIDCDHGLPERTMSYNDLESIKQGVLQIGNKIFVIFKLGSSINVFIQRQNGTFEHFNIYLFVILHALNDDEILHELTIQYTHFPYVGSTNLMNEMIKCNVISIINGTATVEQICEFFKSDIGFVIRLIHGKLERFPECLREYYSGKLKELDQSPKQPQDWIGDQLNSRLESIKRNRFIKDFMCFLTPVLDQLQERHDLTPEIIEILQFLKELFAFFTPTPPPNM